MPDVLIAPYLPVNEDAAVGGWSLIPFTGIAELEIPAGFRAAVQRLVDAYTVEEALVGLGAVIAPADGDIGAPFDRNAMPRLAHALVAGAVNGNPPLLADNNASPNAGHRMATSENGVLFGHPVTDGRSHAVEDGALVRLQKMYTAPDDEPFPKTSPPVELPTPMFGSFDAEFATATLAILEGDDVAARRLHRAMDWFSIALRNARAVTPDVRVEAARSAMEVLTGAGDETRKLVRAFGDLMREDDTVEETHEGAFWAKGPVQLTADEWWMTRLCELRNKIVHGDPIPEALWRHNGHHQIDHIHDRLIRALRAFVADRAGNSLLLKSGAERTLARAYRDAAARLGGGDAEPET